MPLWHAQDNFTHTLCVENSLGPCHSTGNHLPFCFLEGHVQSHASSCGICGEQSGNGTGFSLSSLYSPCHCHSSSSPYSFIHSFIYQRCNIIFPIDSVVREQTSRQRESSWGAMFLRTLHGLVTALNMSAPCYSLCADVLNIWLAFSQSIHSSFCVIACHMYWSRHFQVTGFSSCFVASVGLLKKEVLSSGERLHTENEVMK